MGDRVPEQDIDPRILALPPSWLARLGMDLTPYAWRWLRGGCPRCAALVFIRPAGDGLWRRMIRHEPRCLVLAHGGRVPGAWLN